MINTLPIQAGQTIDANPHRINFATIASEYNSHDRNNYGVHGLGINDSIATVSFYTELLEKNKPIGTVIPIWDNDILEVQMLVDADIWTMMDGSIISDIDSPFNGVQLPDLSEAYLVCKTGSGISKNKNSTHTKSLVHTHTNPHQHILTHGNHAFIHGHNSSSNIKLEIYIDNTNRHIYMNTKSSPTWSYETDGEKLQNISTTNISSFSGSLTQIYSKTQNEKIEFNSTTTSVSANVSTGYGDNKSQSTSTLFDNNALDMSSISVKPRAIKCRYYLRYK